MVEKYKKEILSFQNIWRGGFYMENKEKRNQVGLENYLKKNTKENLTILEIGCGRGRWSKFIYENLNPKKIICLDVLSAEHNNFWSFVGHEKKDKIEYIQVKDFMLSSILDESIDFVFSYDVWCHISESSQKIYLENLHKKCKKNSQLLIMYADPKKYLNSEPENYWFIKNYLPENEVKKISNNEELIKLALNDSDGEIKEGRWYWIGKDKFIKNVVDYDYKIIYEDLGIDKTNVLTLFQK